MKTRSPVTLAPVRINAYQAFLSHLSELPVAQFVTASRYMGRWKASSNREGICVIPFRSFIIRKVCMFAGNVDMCLWRTANGQCSCVGNVGEFLEEKKENRTEGGGATGTETTRCWCWGR